MITIVKGKAILQLSCGCNTRKFEIRDEESDKQGFDADMAELSEFIDNHDKICWSKEGNK